MTHERAISLCASADGAVELSLVDSVAFDEDSRQAACNRDRTSAGVVVVVVDISTAARQRPLFPLGNKTADASYGPLWNGGRGGPL